MLMLARHKSLPLCWPQRLKSRLHPLRGKTASDMVCLKLRAALEVTLQKHWVNWRVVVDDHHDSMTEPAEPWLFRGGYIDSISQPDACFFFVCYLMHLFLLVDSCSIPSVALKFRSGTLLLNLAMMPCMFVNLCYLYWMILMAKFKSL